ncbi:MAG: hypothetical protein V8Q30_13075 [Acutalibacteraceae bacterium]
MYIGSKPGIISQFERYSLYLSFELEVWAELAAQVKPTSYRRGDTIRPGGDTSARITIMLSGVAQVGTVLQSGRGIVTHIIGPAAVWGMPITYADDVTLPTRTPLTAMSEFRSAMCPGISCCNGWRRTAATISTSFTTNAANRWYLSSISSCSPFPPCAA